VDLEAVPLELEDDGGEAEEEPQYGEDGEGEYDVVIRGQGLRGAANGLNYYIPSPLKYGLRMRGSR